MPRNESRTRSRRRSKSGSRVRSRFCSRSSSRGNSRDSLCRNRLRSRSRSSVRDRTSRRSRRDRSQTRIRSQSYSLSPDKRYCRSRGRKSRDNRRDTSINVNYHASSSRQCRECHHDRNQSQVPGPSRTKDYVTNSDHHRNDSCLLERSHTPPLPDNMLTSRPTGAGSQSVESVQRSEISTIAQALVEAIKTVGPNKSHNYFISNFDPALHNIDTWCEEVERAKNTNNWSDHECLSRVASCLKGDAKVWLAEWVTNDRTWSNFRREFTPLCPSKLDFANILFEAMKTTSDRYTTYAEYARRTLLRLRVVKGLSEELRTLIVIRGIDNAQIRAAAANADLTSEKLVSFLSIYTKPGKTNHDKRPQIPHKRLLSHRPLNNEEKTCFNCGLKGHLRVNCLICVSKKRVPRAPQQHITSWEKPDIPFDTIHVDALGPLPLSNEYKFVLIIIDAFTKYCLLFPIYRQDVVELKRVMTQAVSLFGVPRLMVADKGRMFESREFVTWVNDLGCDLHYITPEMHQANGQVERYVRTVLNMIRVETNHKGSSWSEVLWKLQLVLNVTKHKSTRTSPLNLLVGTDATTPVIRALVRDVATENSRPNREALREMTRSRATQLLKENQTHQDEYSNRHRRPPREFALGDLVFVIKFSQCTGKLDPGMRGPYKVVNILPGGRYELTLLSGSYGKTTQAAAQYMVPWRGEWCPETCAAFFDNDESEVTEGNPAASPAQGPSTLPSMPLLDIGPEAGPLEAADVESRDTAPNPRVEDDPLSGEAVLATSPTPSE